MERKPWLGKRTFVFFGAILLLSLVFLLFFPSTDESPTSSTDPFDSPIFCKSPWQDVPVFAPEPPAQVFLVPAKLQNTLMDIAQTRRLFIVDAVIGADTREFAYEIFANVIIEPGTDTYQQALAFYQQALKNAGWEVLSCEQPLQRARGEIWLCHAQRATITGNAPSSPALANDYLVILISRVESGIFISHYRLIPVNATSRCTREE